MIRYKQLKESSLSRIWQHVNNPDISFGVVSAYRQDLYSEEENLKKHEKLKKDIRSMGYGFIEQNSGYSYQDKKTGLDKMVEEKSYFIPGITFEDCLKLGKRYKQESVLYKDNERGFGLFLSSNGKLDMKFKNKDQIYSFKSGDIKSAYSQLVRSNNNNKIKFSYVLEYYIPSMTDAYRNTGSGKLLEAKWIKII